MLKMSAIIVSIFIGLSTWSCKTSRPGTSDSATSSAANETVQDPNAKPATPGPTANPSAKIENTEVDKGLRPSDYGQTSCCERRMKKACHDIIGTGDPVYLCGSIRYEGEEGSFRAICEHASRFIDVYCGAKCFERIGCKEHKGSPYYVQ